MGNKIIYGQKALEEFWDWLNVQPYSNIFILVDENTDKFCLPVLLKKIGRVFPENVIRIPAGEPFKNFPSCDFIWEKLLDLKADRKSLLINLGGGVVSDLGGYVAATYKRGIDFVNIPTTLLAMTDASIGGKTGINFKGYKNQIGVFYDPRRVVIYPPFLETLRIDHLKAGFAEMIKHALIADERFWKKIQKIDTNSWKEIEPFIKKSIQIKLKIVKKDREERGNRKKLNFGHTVGHAIESYVLEKNNKPMLHGDAVASGMIVESYLSHKRGGLSNEEFEHIQKFISDRYPAFKMNHEATNDIINYMRADKKNVNGSVNFSLISKAGESSTNNFIEIKEIKKALEKFFVK